MNHFGTLSAGEVAALVGVAVTTLRSWHQRYGLGPSGHATRSHRRYSALDVARVQLMRDLIANGVPPRDAGSYARTATGLVVETNLASATGTAAPAGTPSLRRLAGDHPDPVVRELASAAARMNASHLRIALDDLLTSGPVEAAWTAVLCPLLVSAGEDASREPATGIGVEHMLSLQVSAALAGRPRPATGAGPDVLLACAEEEQHSLPIEALAAALAGHGVACNLLGGRTPRDVLARAIRRTLPRAVLVWSHQAGTADPTHFADAGARRRPRLMAAGGPGWNPATLPPRVHTPATMPEAIALIMDTMPDSPQDTPVPAH